jgi:excisionase family DNA binding protein
MDTVSGWRSPAAALDVFREQHHFLEGVNMPEEHPRFVTESEAAKHLRVDRGTLYRMLRRREFPPSMAFKIGSDWRMDLDELERFLKANPADK